MKKIAGVILLLMTAFQMSAFAQNAEIVGVSSSSYYQSYKAQNAVDGNPSTYWLSSSTATTIETKYSEKYLQLDLGESKSISAVELSARNNAYAYERSDFELRFSNSADFKNYVKVPCVITTAKYPERLMVGAAYENGETYRKEIDLPDKYRYVRYVKLYDKTNKNASISEIKVETEEAKEVENTNPKDFEIDASFKDAAGDKTNIYVKNSNIVFAGDIKNNTGADTEVYSVIAAYKNDGTLAAVDVTQGTSVSDENLDFEAKVNLVSDIARVSGYVFKKDNLKPLCQMYNTITYYTQKSLDIFVSQQNGNDANDGTILKPLKTLAAAETKAQSLKSQGAVNVNIKNGEYFVTETYTISGDGHKTYAITYKGFGNEETILSGGKKVTGFANEGNGIYSADVDLEYVSDIYVNDERRYVASSDILLGKSSTSDATNAIYGPVVDGEFLPENLSYTDGMEIFYPAVLWRSYTLKLQGITKTDGDYLLKVKPNKVITDRTTYKEIPMDFDKRPFYLRDSKQLLDEAGEWYFDKSQKKLYYIPYSDEIIDECEVYASGAVDTIIRIENGKYYRNFENLTFAHTGWKNAAANGEVRWQGNQQILPSASSLGSAPHNIPIPGALQASFSNNIKVKDCVFKHTGGAGLVLSGPTKNNVIDGNVFYDIADSSMYLGYNNKSYKYKASNINVTNNVITGTGKKYYTASAVTVYGAEKTYISHNDISDCPYTGIHVGPLMWDNEFTSESSAEHNAGEYSGDIHIENNRIHEIAKTNVDGAAIYTLGHNHDSTIRGNYIKNQYMDYSAIYNDDGSACFEIKDNVSENVPGWLYHWNDDIFFVNASNNYSTTNENYGGLKSLQSSIEDVNIFSSDNKPEVVNQIIANAGLENEYAQKIGKYIPNEPEVVVPEFENVYINTQTNVETMLNAGFEANDSNRYCWKAIGSNSSKVSFKDSLTTYWNKGMQFDKIYAMFSTAGTYEILCQADDGRGNIYANKITVTVK